MKRKIYNQIWDKIKELINNIEDVSFRFSDYSRDHNVITFDTDDTLPLDAMVSAYSMQSLLDLFIRLAVILSSNLFSKLNI